MEDRPRTDLGQAEDKKDLQRAAYRGKVQFYQKFFWKVEIMFFAGTTHQPYFPHFNFILNTDCLSMNYVGSWSKC